MKTAHENGIPQFFPKLVINKSDMKIERGVYDSCYSCIAYRMHSDTSTKEPFISAKEPFISAKEPFISANDS